jgi:hypothetical protein
MNQPGLTDRCYRWRSLTSFPAARQELRTDLCPATPCRLYLQAASLRRGHRP